MSDVTDLLAQSRAAHMRMQAEQRAERYPTMQAAIADALRLREQAHAADPDHLDTGWLEDPVDHMDLVEFYCRASESWPQ